MKKIIRLSKASLGKEEIENVIGVLERDYLGMGNDVRLFEIALRDYFSRPVVCVNSGTAALHLAVQACGIKRGDEVLVQSLTFVGSFQAISASGATPIACEINPETLTIDCKDAESKITQHTKAIMPVHYASDPGNLQKIYELAKSYNLRVIEDAAHAFGTIYENRLIGSQGDVVCFSFDGIKNITAGEGGAVVSEDRHVIERIQDLRLLGIEKDTQKRYEGLRSWEFDIKEQGWRYHMSNIMAAIGLAQLQRFPAMLKRRQSLAMLYDKCLKENQRIFLFNRDYTAIVPHIYVIRIHDLKERSKLQERLLGKGIQTGVHYLPNHRLTYYRHSSSLSLPLTESIYEELLTLPLHPELTEEDVFYVCEELGRAIDH